MSFYQYRQNNSGGIWGGPAINLFIEANSSEEADKIAVQHGVYFDEEYAIDCPCCGTRWYGSYEDGKMDEPKIYGKTIEESIQELNSEERGWGGLYKVKGVPYAMVVRADGTVETHRL